jgi:hypothetical protein
MYCFLYKSVCVWLKNLLHELCNISMYNTNKQSYKYQSNLETNQAVTYYVASDICFLNPNGKHNSLKSYAIYVNGTSLSPNIARYN